MFIVTSPRSSVRARETESNGAAFNPLSLVRCAGAGDSTSRALCRCRQPCRAAPCRGAKFDTHMPNRFTFRIRKYFHDYEMFTLLGLTLTLIRFFVNAKWLLGYTRIATFWPLDLFTTHNSASYNVIVITIHSKEVEVRHHSFIIYFHRIFENYVIRERESSCITQRWFIK